eukprot:TRINITY_DN14008_c0_g1_i1.p1 TRINITY_DN14008_c0_g1~~TRINITY_DN14008_c0_g1_i1.p1  ORF type:complete len:256 (-),score=38.93 TRINITY_DN14008_c0_g1_i1:118-885(-)
MAQQALNQPLLRAQMGAQVPMMPIPQSTAAPLQFTDFWVMHNMVMADTSDGFVIAFPDLYGTRTFDTTYVYKFNPDDTWNVAACGGLFQWRFHLDGHGKREAFPPFDLQYLKMTAPDASLFVSPVQVGNWLIQRCIPTNQTKHGIMITNPKSIFIFEFTHESHGHMRVFRPGLGCCGTCGYVYLHFPNLQQREVESPGRRMQDIDEFDDGMSPGTSIVYCCALESPGCTSCRGSCVAPYCCGAYNTLAHQSCTLL